MKQVVFAVILMAMASLTGCLNTEDSPVDENIDTTDDSTSDTTEDNSDTTDDTKDDELIEPVGTTGYTPPDKANITIDTHSSNSSRNEWVAKDGNQITTSCDILDGGGWGDVYNFVVYDSDDRIIYLVNGISNYGINECGKVDVILGPEPVKVGLYEIRVNDSYSTYHYHWIVTF